MNVRRTLFQSVVLLTALIGLFLVACGNDGSGGNSDVHGEHIDSSSEAEGEARGVHVVPVSKAEEATLSCGEYGFGMGLDDSDLPMVRCIIDKSRNEEGRADLLSGMMQDAIHSSNQVAVQLLLDADVDASGDSPLGEPFLLSALSQLTFADRGFGPAHGAENAAAIADSLVDEGARIPEPLGGEYVNVWFAVVEGSPDATRIMVRAGMDVNVRRPLDERFDVDTALVGVVSRACWGGNSGTDLEIVRVLVEAGVDVNTMSIGQILDDSGGKVIGLFEVETVLNIAEDSDCTTVVSVLREAGACRDLEGRKVEWGSNLDFEGILKFLSAASAFTPREDVKCVHSESPTDPQSTGTDDLYDAIRSGEVETVQSLVNAGADVNGAASDGKSMLEWAIISGGVRGSPDIVRILVDSGADVNAKARAANSILQLATVYGNSEVVRILTDAGAKR